MKLIYWFQNKKIVYPKVNIWASMKDPKFNEIALNHQDMKELCKLSNKELRKLLKSWRTGFENSIEHVVIVDDVLD